MSETRIAETSKPTCSSDESPNEDLLIVEGNEYIAMQPVKVASKQSHTCCGCCCDTRRAVIVVNIISICLAALAILSIAMVSSDMYAAQFDDDQVLLALSEIDGTKVGMTISFAAFGILCNASGIFGARRFNPLAIMVAGSWYLVEFVRSMVYLDIGGAIMAGFFVYPHVVFWQEMRKGIMTPSRYNQEERCCNCC